MATLQLVRVHELGAVEEIIAQAVKIADGIEGAPAAWDAVFNKAVDLLSARIPIAPQPAMFAPPDLGMRRQ